MRKVILFLLPFFVLLSWAGLWAQESSPQGGLPQGSPLQGSVEEPAYITYLSGNVDVDRTPENEVSDFEPAELDMELLAGSTIRTGRKAICEITMPEGSMVRLGSGTVFQIEYSSIDRDTGRMRERFNFLAGKFKAKVNKFTTADSEFSVISGTALAGVRGTVLGGSVKAGKGGADFLCFDGKLVIESTTGAYEPVVLNTGQMSFVPWVGTPSPVQAIPQQTLQAWEQEFKTEGEEAPVPEEAEEEPKPEDEWLTESWEPQKQMEKPKSALEGILALNAWIGTINIDNNVYAHWVFTPELTIGKFGMGLYLPAIFAPEVGLFGFNEWYNHDEWDFLDLQDSIHDALLKFYYISYGIKGDPFFFKIGGIDDFTLGHGFIVNGYSNMVYFPKERTMGLQLDVDTDGFGFQTMIADFSRFQLFGGRIYARPLGRVMPLAFGLTTIRDRPVPSSSSNEQQESNVFVFGVDVELPIFNTEKFGMKIYADGAKVGYLYPELPATLSGKASAATLGFLPGMGTGIGLMGHVSGVFSYRAEYRFITGYYEPGFIGSMWENRRLYYGQELEGLIADTSYREDTQAGFLLRGDLLFFEKIEFGIGLESYRTTRYSITESKNVVDTVSKGDVSLGIKKGLIPRFYGSVSYKREDGLESVFQQPIDINTKLEASVVYDLADGVTIAVDAKRTFQYNDATGEHEPIDSLGVRTIITFF